MYLCVLLRAAESHFFFRYLELNFTAKILNYILIAFTWKKTCIFGFLPTSNFAKVICLSNVFEYYVHVKILKFEDIFHYWFLG